MLFVATSYLLIVIARSGIRRASILRLDEPNCCLVRRDGYHTLAFLFRGITLGEGRRRIKSFTSNIDYLERFMFSERKEWRSGPRQTFLRPMCDPWNWKREEETDLDEMSREDGWMRWDLIGLRQWMANGGGGAARRRHGSESAATMLMVAQQWR